MLLGVIWQLRSNGWGCWRDLAVGRGGSGGRGLEVEVEGSYWGMGVRGGDGDGRGGRALSGDAGGGRWGRDGGGVGRSRGVHTAQGHAL